MSETSKRVDLRFGDLALCLEGFEDPVQPVKQILRCIQRIVEETPEITNIGFTFDPALVEELTREVAHKVGGGTEPVSVTPGLIVTAGGAEPGDVARQAGPWPGEAAPAADPPEPEVVLADAIRSGTGEDDHPLDKPGHGGETLWDGAGTPGYAPVPEDPAGMGAGVTLDPAPGEAPSDAAVDEPGSFVPGEEAASPIAEGEAVELSEVRAPMHARPEDTVEAGTDAEVGVAGQAPIVEPGDADFAEFEDVDELEPADEEAVVLGGGDHDPADGAIPPEAEETPLAAFDADLAADRDGASGAEPWEAAPADGNVDAPADRPETVEVSPHSRPEPEAEPEDDPDLVTGQVLWQEDMSDPEPARDADHSVDPEGEVEPDRNIFAGPDDAAEADPKAAPDEAATSEPEAPGRRFNLFGFFKGAPEPDAEARAEAAEETNIFSDQEEEPDTAALRSPFAPDPTDPADDAEDGLEAAPTADDPEPSTQQNDPPRGDEPGPHLSSRFETLVERFSAGSEPERYEAPDASEPAQEPSLTAADLARRAEAESVPDLLASAAAWLTLIRGQDRFSRSDVMEVFEEMPGEHERSLEARIKGYGRLVRNGVLTLIDDGHFTLNDEERARFERLL